MSKSGTQEGSSVPPIALGVLIEADLVDRDWVGHLIQHRLKQYGEAWTMETSISLKSYLKYMCPKAVRGICGCRI